MAQLMTEFFRIFDSYTQPFQCEYIQYASDINEACKMVESIKKPIHNSININS